MAGYGDVRQSSEFSTMAAMAELDIQQIIHDAQTRWLRAGEVAELLRMCEKYELKTSSTPPYKPTSGSLFLFNRKAVKHFRKDGHNWRKKKDKKTVMEAHERLKVGNVNVLHCYYAHGEENSSFQRRSYWMLDQEPQHIVFVHYLDVMQSSRATARLLVNAGSPETPVNGCSETDGNSEAEIEKTHYNSASLMEQLGGKPISMPLTALSLNEQSVQHWQQMKEQTYSNEDLSKFLDLDEPCNFLNEFDHDSRTEPDSSGWAELLELCNDPQTSVQCLLNPATSPQTTLEEQLRVVTENHPAAGSKAEADLGSCTSDSFRPNPSSKEDSFQWFRNEIVGDSGSPIMPLSEPYSNTIDEVVDTGLSSLSNQKFNLVDFSPEWAYCSVETKVLVTGEFIHRPLEHTWCCMFGEVEVPAEILSTGVLRCKTPAHASGTVVFYVTCGDRTAASQIREFEFREASVTATEPAGNVSSEGSKELLLLQLRFVRLLLKTDAETSKITSIDSGFYKQIDKKLKEIRKYIGDQTKSISSLNEQHFEVILKHSLYKLLAEEEGQVSRAYDDEGQGILHIAAALGYDWAISLISGTGVGVNFRDKHGWTALHWAAFCGRERTVLSLLEAGAVPELLTDPTQAEPNGLTPADLAASNGHGGIAGYLAEASLQHHLSVLTLKEDHLNEIHFTNAALAADSASFQLLEKSDIYRTTIGSDDKMSLRQSLGAVRRATEAAALIQSAFRQFSFQQRRKQEDQQQFAITNEMSLEEIQEIMACKIQNAYRSHSTKIHSAATKIQSKYRGWKGRREFLVTRKRVIKIQAHVRGYRARREYVKILWSVGVLEKLILRWHRGRHGLRGFQADDNIMSDIDDDFLRDGRKQKELVLGSAVECVKSMVHSPQSRAQYSRLLEESQKHDKQRTTEIDYMQ